MLKFEKFFFCQNKINCPNKIKKIIFSIQTENGNTKLPSSPSSTDVIQLASTQKGDNIMQKLVPGTEGASTLVGTLENITKPLVGFIRLTEATVMPNLMEVPIPGLNLNNTVQPVYNDQPQDPKIVDFVQRSFM